jgi:hypothetical protein
MAVKRDDFPLPDLADERTAEFFAGAARDELVIPQCDSCAAFCWYPEPECPRCGYLGWAPAASLDERTRRLLRERPPYARRLRRVA